ncbi:HAMP domain-containing histidine kinase [Blautia schinkii]|nr:HAMP domain-containing histidine kinase [Blautia schinkii]
MFFLMAAFVLIIVILAVLLILYIREVRHLIRQLELLEAGSHIELTTNTGSRVFVVLYQKLNHIFSTVRSRENQHLRAQKQLKQSVSDLAHDIRTPLTSASGYLQMLEDCTESEKQLRYEQIIEKRIAELKDMLEELFLYTKLTSEDFSPELQSTAVFPVLSDCMIGLYHVFEEKQIEPEIMFENEEICVTATPEILGRIFRNLINNALLHGAGGLRVIQEGGSIAFMNLVNNADGIEADRIFERFYKADSTRKKGSSGLGLSIVKELCLRIGGTAEAELVNGNMLKITVSLPVAKPVPHL